MKRVIALTSLLVMLAFACIACGSPRGSGNGSIQTSAAASVAKYQSKVRVNFATAPAVERAVQAADATASIDRAEPPAAIATRTAAVRQPFALYEMTLARPPSDADIYRINVQARARTSTYNEPTRAHRAREDV